MDDRPIKGNASGKYSVVLDPNNDLPAYYNGVTDLSSLIVEMHGFRKSTSRA